jgi:hypothetical protein
MMESIWWVKFGPNACCHVKVCDGRKIRTLYIATTTTYILDMVDKKLRMLHSNVLETPNKYPHNKQVFFLYIYAVNVFDKAGIKIWNLVVIGTRTARLTN